MKKIWIVFLILLLPITAWGIDRQRSVKGQANRTWSMITERGDFIGPNVLVYIPFNEGSGTTFADDADGDITLTDASAAFTVAHAVTMNTGSYDSLGTGSLDTIPAGKILIFVCGSSVNTATAFSNCIIGDSSSTVRIGLAGGAAIVEDDNGVDETGTNPAGTPGQNLFIAFVVNSTTQEVKTYSSVNGAASTLKGTESAGPAGPFTFPRKGTFSTNNFESNFYGMVLWSMDSEPSEADVNTHLDWIQTEWTAGHNVLPGAWSGN